jgi:hypothetical protein
MNPQDFSDYDITYSDYEKLADKMFQQVKREAITTQIYKDLTRRRYRDPKGYVCHKEVMRDLVVNLLMTSRISEDTWQVSNNSSRSAASLIQEWYLKKGGSYWLDNNLFEAFQNTDMPDKIGNLKQVIPVGLLMLPKGLKTPDGEALNWIVFAHQLKPDHPSPISLGKMVFYPEKLCDYEFVMWASVLPSTTIYSNLLKVDHPDETELFDSFRGGKRVLIEGEQAFIKQVTSIVIQSLLIAQIHPEMLGADNISSKNRGGGFSKEQREKWLNPNWIGRNFKVRSPSTPSAPTDRHLPFHWRRGHMRRVVVGKRSEEQREWRWIQPYMVGLDEEQT